MRRATVPRSGLAIFVSVFMVAFSAHAVDGVIEINQAKALVGGVTTGDAAGFPVSINDVGSYRLTSNLIPPGPLANAVEINASAVVLDLNGFAIDGGTSCTVSGGVPSSVNCTTGGFTNAGIAGTAVGGVTIRNGFIGHTTGAAIDLSSTQGVMLQDLVVGQSASAFYCIRLGLGSTVLRIRAGVCNGSVLVMGASAQVYDSRAGGSNLEGMYLGTASRVRDSEASSNATSGIRCEGSCVLTDNLTLANGIHGIYVTTTDSALSGNVSNFNAGYGASLIGGSNYGENVFQTNGTGPVTGGVSRGNNTCNGVSC